MAIAAAFLKTSEIACLKQNPLKFLQKRVGNLPFAEVVVTDASTLGFLVQDNLIRIDLPQELGFSNVLVSDLPNDEPVPCTCC